MGKNFTRSKKHKNHKGGNTIHGNTDWINLDERLGQARTYDGVSALRDDLKAGTALRMQYNHFNLRLPINENNVNKITEIIESNIHDEYISSFVRCTINYYAGIEPTNVKIDTSAKYCNARNSQKALRHAQKDCKEVSKKYIQSALEYFDNQNNEADIEIVKRLRAAMKAIYFFADYVYDLLISYIPNNLDKYTFTESTNNYIQNRESIAKKIRYASLPIENATEIFCKSYRFL